MTAPLLAAYGEPPEQGGGMVMPARRPRLWFAVGSVLLGVACGSTAEVATESGAPATFEALRVNPFGQDDDAGTSDEAAPSIAITPAGRLDTADPGATGDEPDVTTRRPTGTSEPASEARGTSPPALGGTNEQSPPTGPAPTTATTTGTTTPTTTTATTTTGTTTTSSTTTSTTIDTTTSETTTTTTGSTTTPTSIVTTTTETTTVTTTTGETTTTIGTTSETPTTITEAPGPPGGFCTRSLPPQCFPYEP